MINIVCDVCGNKLPIMGDKQNKKSTTIRVGICGYCETMAMKLIKIHMGGDFMAGNLCNGIGDCEDDMAKKCDDRQFCNTAGLDCASARTCMNAPDDCDGCPLYASRRDEYAWLVEASENGRAWWLAMCDRGFEWTTDSLKALRFARKADAEAVARFHGMIMPDRFDGKFFATDHVWSAA